MIVLDTHVLLWAALGDRKLGRKARVMIDRRWANGELAVPAIAFWEIGLLEVRGRLRYELRATWLGGTRILDRLVAVRFDVVNRRPTLGLSDAPWFAWQMLTWANPRAPLAYGSRSL